MLRDLQTVHRNTTFADLPEPVQDSIAQSVRAAFTQLLKEGYAVGPKQQVQQSRPMDRVPERDRRAALLTDAYVPHGSRFRRDPDRPRWSKEGWPAWQKARRPGKAPRIVIPISMDLPPILARCRPSSGATSSHRSSIGRRIRRWIGDIAASDPAPVRDEVLRT